MNLTVSLALAKLTQARAFPQDLDDDGKIAMLNEALEALMIHERYVGSEARLSFKVDLTGILTLPRDFVTLKAAAVDGKTRDLASPWYEFTPGSDATTQFSLLVEDLEDRWPTFADPIITPASLKAVISESPSDGFLEVHGRDADGREVWNGTQRGAILNFNDTYTDTGIVYIDEIIKPITDRVVYLYAEDGSTNQLIGQYEPGETLPSYRRYFVPEATQQANAVELPPTPPMIVTALCQRRHVDMINETDVLPLTNFNGLKHAVLSTHWYNEGDEARGESHMNTALNFFSSELRRQRPPTELGAVHIRAVADSGASNLHSFR